MKACLAPRPPPHPEPLVLNHFRPRLPETQEGGCEAAAGRRGAVCPRHQPETEARARSGVWMPGGQGDLTSATSVLAKRRLPAHLLCLGDATDDASRPRYLVENPPGSSSRRKPNRPGHPPGSQRPDWSSGPGGAAL